MYSLVDGYTKPKVKVFEYHADGEKHPEIVHAQYQNISLEYVETVQELLSEHAVKPWDVTGVFLAVGGDHGQGAFRICFRLLLRLKDRELPIYKTKAIAEVYCKKEEGVLLDNSVIPW
eukprot:CAMPEP_0184435336 /NCGR_PEP_ID=MMETSP0738-20130409/485517_1 /TAXON_ID=385413 /ORGANISM="Thalassiosira miniscula, Strain CCMP1093" /LENGTH=117 /DNA_ID=CAMNT_0026801683 /DNA_START=228 /DNA_END=578 /DNA_ORIENTATION=+